MSNLICPYCGNRSVLTKDPRGNYIWECRPCDARVGTHKNSRRHAPLGRLANAELRWWKVQAHEAFDPLWNKKAYKTSYERSKARSAAYWWLAQQLDIPAEHCHIGKFGVELCQKTVEVCYERGIRQ